MNDDVIRLSVIGQIIRRRWRVLAVAAVVGALVGSAVSLLISPGYQASSQVLMQGSRETDELLTESQIAVSSPVLERAAAALRWDDEVSDLREDVQAEIVDGNVIEIRAHDDDPRRARDLANQVANEFVIYSSQLASNPANASAQVVREQRNALQVQVRDSLRKLSDLHREVSTGELTPEEVGLRTELEQVRTDLTGAVQELEEAEAASTRTNAVVIEPAETPSSPAPPNTWQLTAAGALAGFLVGIAGHLIAARGDRRLRGSDPIGAALGAAVIGQVPVAEQPPARATSRWRRLAQLLGTDRPWQTPDGEIAGEARYRRVLAKLRTGHGVPLRLLLVVTDDDPAARAVAQRMMAGAAHDSAVATNGHSYADHGSSENRANTGNAGNAGNAENTARPTLRLVEVSAEQSDVPEDSAVSGALIVVSAGQRTGWELAALAEACRDAGLRLAGVVVARPIRTHGDEPVEESVATSEHELVGAS